MGWFIVWLQKAIEAKLLETECWNLAWINAITYSFRRFFSEFDYVDWFRIYVVIFCFIWKKSYCKNKLLLQTQNFSICRVKFLSPWLATIQSHFGPSFFNAHCEHWTRARSRSKRWWFHWVRETKIKIKIHILLLFLFPPIQLKIS